MLNDGEVAGQCRWGGSFEEDATSDGISHRDFVARKNFDLEAWGESSICRCLEHTLKQVSVVGVWQQIRLEREPEGVGILGLARDIVLLVETRNGADQ